MNEVSLDGAEAEVLVGRACRGSSGPKFSSPLSPELEEG